RATSRTSAAARRRRARRAVRWCRRRRRRGARPRATPPPRARPRARSPCAPPRPLAARAAPHRRAAPPIPPPAATRARPTSGAAPRSPGARSRAACAWIAASPKLLPQAEHVLHVVEPGIAIAQPLGRAHGAARERLARRGAMCDLEPLAEAAEVGGVLADDVAAAHRVDADLLDGARADLALAAVARHLTEIALE